MLQSEGFALSKHINKVIDWSDFTGYFCVFKLTKTNAVKMSPLTTEKLKKFKSRLKFVN